MEFHEKRPVFQAAQFDGTTDSVAALMDIGDFYQYTIESNNHESKLTFYIGSGKPDLMNKSDWLVKYPSGAMVVLTRHEFSKRFEKVAERPKTWATTLSNEIPKSGRAV